MSFPTSHWSFFLKQRSAEPESQYVDIQNNSSIEGPQTSNSNAYEALTLALARLSPRELAQCRVVCKLWRETASSTEVRRASFVQHWRLAGLVGEARNLTLLDTATLGHFVRRHPVQRGDSLTGLAVRHGCNVTSIMRLNNLISHHSLHSRAAVFLPVSSRSEVAGAHALFEYCRVACRELLVLLSREEAAGAAAAQLSAAAVRGGADGAAGAQRGGLRRGQEEAALQGKLVTLLGRSRRLDEHTARFYLAEAGWCLKKALALYEQDMQWEVRAPGGRRRRSPLQPLSE